MPGDCAKALGFWTVGIQYLHLVQSISNETHQQGNAHFVVSNTEITATAYAEATKWSDHNLVIPLLFNFYHGLEVILKGYIHANESGAIHSHKLSELLITFKSYHPCSPLYALFEKYIIQTKLPAILAEFCSTSSITIDEYYQALKYPESTRGNQYHHHPLKNREAEGANFFAELRDDIERIRIESVASGRIICPQEA